MKKLLLAILIITVGSFYSVANTIVVNSLNSLTNAYTNAFPGDSVIIANGTYNWGAISLSNVHGNANGKWIVVKSQTLGGVIFTGSTYLKFDGTKIQINGLKFANGDAGTNPVISFRTSTSNLANYSRVCNIIFDNYNTPSPDGNTENEWIGIYGIRNRVDHCNFINKNNARATVVVWYSTATFPDKSISTYHKIDSNYFSGRSYMGGNGGETIRVGVGNNSRTDGYNIIEYNLFEGCTQTEPEIVSNKSCRNTYRYNTFKNCNGGLTLRMGKYCEAYGNYFINDDSRKTDSYGIRIIDKGHKVYNNYFEGLLGSATSNTTMRTPIVICNGSFAASDSLNPLILNGEYLPADSAVVAFNTIVNCKGIGIKIGHNDNGLALFQPLGIKFANNAIKMSTGRTSFIESTNTSLTYSAEGNKYNAPNGLGLNNTSGFSQDALSFGTRVNGILTPPSTLLDAAINTSNYNTMLSNLDAQKQFRSSIYDVGCDEINGSGNIVTHPLDSSIVGAGNPQIVLPNQTIIFPAIPPVSIISPDLKNLARSDKGLPIYYSSSNPSVATVINNSIHIVDCGNSVITASQPGNAYFNAALPVAQTLTVTCDSNFIGDNLFPNPTMMNSTTLLYHLDKESMVSISVFNQTGKLIEKLVANEKMLAGVHKQEIKTTKLSKGKYYVILYSGNSKKVFSLLNF